MHALPHRLFHWLALGLTCALLAGVLARPAAAQDRFRERNYRVRIGVLEDVERVALQGVIAYEVRSSQDQPLAQLQALAPYFVEIVKGEPGKKTYRLVLREMDPHNVEGAINLAKQAKEQHQLPVKVFRIPSRDPGDARILVTMGEFPSIEEARGAVSKLNNEQIKLIYEDRAIAVRGEVRLIDQSGNIVARDQEKLRLEPSSPGDGDCSLKEIEGQTLTAAGLRSARHYRGTIELAINREGTLTAINELWIEYYLYSVVSAEIGDDAPIEAQKAQAVAGRSEAVAKIERRMLSSALFDFYDTPLSQAYPGRKSENGLVRKAVDDTRGEILVSNGQAVDAVYSHSCGGLIASSKDMWDGENEGYAVRHLDRLSARTNPDLSAWQESYDFLTDNVPALCNPNQPGFPSYAKKYYRWEKNFSGAEFSRLADDRYNTGRVKDVYIDRRTPSGRVRAVRIIGADRTVTVDRELEIRKALGEIYSTLFVLSKDRDADGYLRSIRINGGGFGHGVGMCQMGATMMAKQGYNYRQILAHYFRDVKIRTLYR